MIYVFDTNSIITLGHYFPDQFPSFWENMDSFVKQGIVISVQEVFRELDGSATRKHLHDWIKLNKGMFGKATSEEVEIVAEIFSIPHFRQLISQKQTLRAGPPGSTVAG